MPRSSIRPSWSSAKALHGSSTASGPVDSPPLALRWSIVMQRKSVLNASIALNTAVGHLLMREFSPPRGVDQQRETTADLLVANADSAAPIKAGARLAGSPRRGVGRSGLCLSQAWRGGG